MNTNPDRLQTGGREEYCWQQARKRSFTLHSVFGLALNDCRKAVATAQRQSQDRESHRLPISLTEGAKRCPATKQEQLGVTGYDSSLAPLDQNKQCGTC